ncbi:hypothetical protein [Lacticaseibacillus sp. N501-2]|uniref:hypothetical protein n=1 Tax=Lacticaseibacillus salsurae TaxID=3367729 RepID=UPI0038B23260
MNINTIISALVAAGGFGYINLSVAEKQGLVNFKSDANTLLPYMLCWSAVDFSVYLLISYWISFFKLAANLSTGLSLIATMIVVYLCAVSLMAPIHRIGDALNNYRRHYDNKSNVSPQSTWEYLTGQDTVQYLYIYTLTHEPVTGGILDYCSKTDDNRLSAQLVPFTNSSSIPAYDDMVASYSTVEAKQKYDVASYIDADRKLLIFSVSEREG